MSSKKFCVDCKHHFAVKQLVSHWPVLHYCERPVGHDLVVGREIHLGEQCRDERKEGVSSHSELGGATVHNCGIEARYFEPKEIN